MRSHAANKKLHRTARHISVMADCSRESLARFISDSRSGFSEDEIFSAVRATDWEFSPDLDLDCGSKPAPINSSPGQDRDGTVYRRITCDDSCLYGDEYIGREGEFADMPA